MLADVPDHVGVEHPGDIFAGGQSLSHLRAADIDQRGLDHVLFQLGHALRSPQRLEPVEIGRRIAGTPHRGQVAFVDQLLDLVPVHEVADAIGADEPVDGGLRAVLALELPHRVERVAGSGALELAIADGEAVVAGDGQLDHPEPVVVTGEGEEPFQRRDLRGNEDQFLGLKSVAPPRPPRSYGPGESGQKSPRTELFVLSP